MSLYCVKQHDTTDCAAACIATISKQYGFNISITKIREIAGTDRKGTSAFGIIKAAEKLGFESKGIRVQKNLCNEKNIPVPCIVHVVVKNVLQHYVVIQKITKNKIIIADPAVGIVKIDKDEFFNDKHNVYFWTGVMILLNPSENFKKNKDGKGLFGRFFYIMAEQKKLLINIIIASLFSTILGILGAFYYTELIDKVLPERLIDSLTILSLGTITLYGVRVLLNAFKTQMVIYMGQRIDIKLLFGYFKHVMKLPMSFYGTRKVGEVISRFSDASSIRNVLANATLTIMIDSVMTVAGGIILFRQNSKMFGVTMIVVLLYAIIVFLFNKLYERLNREQMESSAQLNSYLIESLNGVQTIKSYNVEDVIVSEAENRFVHMLKSIFNIGYVGNIQNSLNYFIESVGGIFILWVGAQSVINGDMSIGQLIAFNSLIGYFLDPIKNLINLQPEIQTAMVAADRLGEILELDIEKNESENSKFELDNLKGDIVFENVSFRYGTRKPVLKNINLNIESGKKIAFVGESGSGKSTLSKLLLKLYDIDEGKITINGNNIDDIKIDTIRNRVSYIPQETFLFSGTVLENLTFCQNNYLMDEVIDATKKANAYDFINNMPLRFNTKIEENGSNLSGGQRQRLSIARALLKDTDILILDEATSNLDAATEKMIDETINEYCKDKTTIFIAHRLSTIKHCDLICVLDNGEIIETGTHEELIDLNGKYAYLVRQQSLERRCNV